MDYIIELSDLLEEEHDPIFDFFNSIRPKNFIKVLQYFSIGHGMGLDYTACTFPADFEECGEESVGNYIEFANHSGAEILVDYPTFCYYLNKACKRYIEIHKTDAEQVRMLVSKIRETLDLAET